jgi:hypothetical protein
VITPPLTTADLFDPRNDHQEIVMNRTRHLRPVRRLATILAGLAAALLATATAAPAAFATRFPPPGIPASAPPAAPAPEHLPPLPPGWNKHPPLGHVVGPIYKVPVHAVIAGGMPGWQIALITAGAALLAVVLAIIAYRIRATHRRVTSPAA